MENEQQQDRKGMFYFTNGKGFATKERFLMAQSIKDDTCWQHFPARVRRWLDPSSISSKSFEHGEDWQSYLAQKLLRHR